MATRRQSVSLAVLPAFSPIIWDGDGVFTSATCHKAFECRCYIEPPPAHKSTTPEEEEEEEKEKENLEHQQEQCEETRRRRRRRRSQQVQSLGAAID
ncbi:hypothetical protein JOB18_033956 [Solea senegalensis]|uniref:Secreted protein n=1 Tax=Solea senegalensis TaxID=28829 RepID=A0AAV6RT40_SOLSE|nr:hypothetical protein JOB18_033956 [Solea senegalensis]